MLSPSKQQTSALLVSLLFVSLLLLLLFFLHAVRLSRAFRQDTLLCLLRRAFVFFAPFAGLTENLSVWV